MNAIRITDSIKLIGNKRVKNYKEESNIGLLPPIELRSSADEIAWQVKALPDDWIPNTKPSKRIEKYIKNKEASHDKNVAKMRHQMTDINIDIEKRIRCKSEILKGGLKQSAKEINGVLGKIKIESKPNRAQIACAADEIEKISADCSLKIAQLRFELKEIEKGRSEKFKAVLKASYEELHRIAFKMPYELQEFFETEILYINQITLNNYRCYEDLDLQLKLKLENDKRQWMKKHEQIKAFEEFERTRIKIKLTGHQSTNLLYCGKLVTTDTLEDFVQKIVERIMNFDGELIMLRESIELTISKILFEQFDDLNVVGMEQGIQIQSAYSVDYLTPLIEESMFDSKEKQINEYTIEMMMKWEELHTTIEDELNESKASMIAALHIFDNHFVRTYEINSLFNEDFEMYTKANSVFERIEYNKTNTLIDKIRMGADEEEIGATMAETKKCIENYLQMFNKNSEKEAKFLEKHEAYLKMDSEIVRLEMQAYLNSHAIFRDVDPKLQRGRASKMNLTAEPVNEQIPIFFEIQNQIRVLHNWMFG